MYRAMREWLINTYGSEMRFVTQWVAAGVVQPTDVRSTATVSSMPPPPAVQPPPESLPIDETMLPSSPKRQRVEEVQLGWDEIAGDWVDGICDALREERRHTWNEDQVAAELDPVYPYEYGTKRSRSF